MLSLLPAWKNVVAAIDAGRWTYGDLISHEDLQELIRLPEPKGSATADQYKNWRLRLLGEVDALKEHLLREKRMALRNEAGVGYRILLPHQQTRDAEAELDKEVARAFKEAAMRIRHVNRDLLTAEQQRENTDAAVRLASKRDALRRINRLPETEIKALAKPKKVRK